MKNKKQVIKEIKEEEKEIKYQKYIERKTKRLAKKISEMSEDKQLELAKKLTNKLRVLNAEMSDKQELEKHLCSIPKKRNINTFTFSVIMVADALILGGCAAAVSQLLTDDFYVQTGSTIAGMMASVFASIGPLYLIENKPISKTITNVRLKNNKNKQDKIDKKIKVISQELSIIK